MDAEKFTKDVEKGLWKINNPDDDTRKINSIPPMPPIDFIQRIEPSTGINQSASEKVISTPSTEQRKFQDQCWSRIQSICIGKIR